MTCEQCGAEFAPYPVIGGEKLDLHGRKRCLDRLAVRHQRMPRKKVDRPPKTKRCESCGASFPAKAVIDGQVRSLYRRRFCLDCSPFGIHNTSKTPPGTLAPEGLREYRRRRRNAKTYRYQKRRRRELKAIVIDLLGGQCIDCGYDACPVALDPHHIDPSRKEFSLGAFDGSMTLLRSELAKCVLLCANCHRQRHAAEDMNAKGGPVVEFRRRLKARAVSYMGDACSGCGRAGHQAIFEFHHRDPAEKKFGITSDGIPRRWGTILAELAKCVMLCANCHREVHAGVREIDDALLGLAEASGTYSRAA